MKVVARGRHLAFVDDNGWEHVRRLHGNHAAIIIPVTKDRHVVFVSQFRKPVDNTTLEFPAGLVGDVREGESILEAAKCELREEAGMVSDNWTLLTSGPTAAGLTNEIITTYLALDCDRIGQGGGNESESESIEVHLIPADHAEVFVRHSEEEGIAIDPKVYAGLYFLKKRNII